jgi:GDPmannose 4,6-dehydratase
MRDWGYAPDYVKAMWMMLQPEEPRDYVVATGETRSVRDFLTAAFACIGVKDWTPLVRIDPRFLRPADVEVLRGDASRIENDLGWRPATPFETWVRRMVQHDVEDVG